MWKNDACVINCATHTNKTEGSLTVLLHLLQNKDSAKTIIYKLDLSNTWNNKHFDDKYSHPNGYNTFLLEWLESERMHCSLLLSYPLIVASRYVGSACRVAD